MAQWTCLCFADSQKYFFVILLKHPSQIYLSRLFIFTIIKSMSQATSTTRNDMLNQPNMPNPQIFSKLDKVELDWLIRLIDSLVIKDESGQSSEHKQEKSVILNTPPTEISDDSQEGFSSSQEKNQIEEPTLEIPPNDQNDDEESTENSPKKKAKKTPKRADGNNNAHKKFVTAQNKVLGKMGSLRKIKAQLKKEEIKDFKKGSRTAFVMRLIDAKKWMNDTQFAQFLTILPQKLRTQFKLAENASEEEELLHHLVNYYCECCHLFSEGKISASVEAIYDIKGAKQEEYRRKGIKAVVKYYQKRLL